MFLFSSKCFYLIKLVVKQIDVSLQNALAINSTEFLQMLKLDRNIHEKK